MSKSRRFVIGLWCCTGVVLAVGGTAHVCGYAVNISDSMPEGVWQKVGQPVALRRGDVVQVCLPPNTPAVQQLRRLHYFGGVGCPDVMTPLLKPAAAVAGDVVVVSQASGITVNGNKLVNTAQLPHDGAGHAIPHVADGRYVVAPGQVWLLSQYNAISLDSRYFGPVPVSAVTSIMRPVWTSHRVAEVDQP